MSLEDRPEETVISGPLHWSELKESLRIETDNHDSKLAGLAIDANLELNKVMQPFTEIPIPIGTNVYVYARSLALLYSRAAWFRELGQTQRHKIALAEYTERLESAIKTLKAERTPRTKSVLVSDDPREAKLRIPAQRDTFVLGDF